MRVIEEELPQPDLNSAPLKTLNDNRKVNGVQYVAGLGDKQKARIMFISPALLKEESDTVAHTVTGAKVNIKPRYMKGMAGATFLDCLSTAFINFDEECYYTAVCKWLVPKANRLKPTKSQLNFGRPLLEAEITEVAPDIIVCLGKTVFDLLVEEKISADDARSAWFRTKQGILVYLMPEITKLSSKPEIVPTFIHECTRVRLMLDSLDGMEIRSVAKNYSVIRGADELRAWVAQMQAENQTIFSLDCEWGGLNHVSGQLRSVQFAWKAGYAVYLRFRDERNEYVFEGATYKEAGDILKPLMDSPTTKYVGHHVSADLPWIHTWLGLEWYDKVLMDTEFAQQCCDEYADLSLERLAILNTDLNRYDMDLIRWKKKNKQKEEDGYAYIPDDILIPYALADVDTVIRSYPKLLLDLSRQNLLNYYFNIFNPFTTNVFTSFVLLGLPIDIQRLDDLRELYTYCRDRLNVKFQEKVYEEAKSTLLERLSDLIGEDAILCVQETMRLLSSGQSANAWNTIKSALPDPSHVLWFNTLFDHLVLSKNFNIRSGKQMINWLYKVKQFKPIKSTSNRDKGLLGIPWEKVEALPEAARQQYTPAADRQSLEILSETYDDELLRDLVLLNAIGNICKAFLKQADVDSDGEVIQENGLHYFICPDGRVHPQYSTTETGRPRTWKPNALNWPKFVSSDVNAAMHAVLDEDYELGILPDSLYAYRHSHIPSIRSCVKAPEGMCFVESDYQTAEVRGLAFISGDQYLIDIMTKPDSQFGIDSKTGKPLRLSYGERCGIPEAAQDPSLLTPADDPRLLRVDGELQHPPTDLHWNLAEIINEIPREKLDKDTHRAAAKVGNFQSAYGATSVTIERKIEQDTGKKPEPNTGDRILSAIAKRQPVATLFLKSLEEVPDRPGYLIAKSGRKRRFATHERMGARAESSWAANSLKASLGREARNFLMQTSVADTSARAGNWLLQHYIDNGMEARPMVILYDALVTLCPLNEVTKVIELHQKYMCDQNGWEYHGRTLNYPIDSEVLLRWSTAPTQEEKTKLV